MKIILAMSLLIGCSSPPEPIGQTSQANVPDCKIVGQFADTTTCTTEIYSQCAGMPVWEYTQTALAANYIGQWCMIESGQTYYYACGINDKGQAWVYCNYPGQ